MRIWNITRAGTDITRDYRTDLRGPMSGLVAAWYFDEGSGTTAFDSSGNHHDATLRDGATFSTDVHP